MFCKCVGGGVVNTSERVLMVNGTAVVGNGEEKDACKLMKIF